MKMKDFLLIAIFTLMTAGLFGQGPAATHSGYKNGLGLNAGFTTGYGISYRYFPGWFGFMTTFAPRTDTSDTHFNMGVTFLVKLIDGERTRFYLYESNSYYYSRPRDKTERSLYYNPPKPEAETYYNNGIGLGIEFLILKHVSFNLMGGYGRFENWQTLRLTGETALYYTF